MMTIKTTDNHNHTQCQASPRIEMAINSMTMRERERDVWPQILLDQQEVASHHCFQGRITPFRTDPCMMYAATASHMPHTKTKKTHRYAVEFNRISSNQRRQRWTDSLSGNGEPRYGILCPVITQSSRRASTLVKIPQGDLISFVLA